MKIKCDWCGSWINDFDQVCPNCGGVNNNYNRHANGVPQTIEELKAWAKEMNLPLQDMRTFIGEDYKGAKAFGIYKDETDGTFVVYKNKEDGTRAVRYKGTDEAYAAGLYTVMVPDQLPPTEEILALVDKKCDSLTELQAQLTELLAVCGD